ncbi:MAG: GIY-YIG nuclease family protein [Methylobacter sp.]|nr:GIY-YIG nuclease family protein [Methylobacter sp.]
MNFGRSIRVYLADGTPSGIRHVEIANWSGQAIACPRSRFAELSKWEEAKRPGIYFLFEKQNADSGNRVYIGESENVIKRLSDHDRNKDFWTEVVIFTSKDENLTKSHIKYLESRLVSIGIETEKYQLENSNTPTESNLPRADKDAMEEFIHNLKIIIGTLGHKFLEPLKAVSVEKVTNTKSTVGIPLSFALKELKAFGQMTDDGFLLLAGSDVSSLTSPSMPGNSKSIRNSWVSAGLLKLEGKNYKLIKDTLISSSSYAAVIVAGTSRSGPQSWQDSTGRTLKVIEDQILNEVINES